MAARKKSLSLPLLIIISLLGIGLIFSFIFLSKKTQTFSKDSKIEPINDTWNKYINYKLGFSLKIPKETNNHYGACEWKGDLGDQSYRPVEKLVSIKVFEHEKGIFIDHEYDYKLTGEKQKSSGRTTYSGCQKQANSVEVLQNRKIPNTWDITVEEVTNESELKAFIQKRFGTGCQMGQKEEADQPGVFDVEVLSDGKPPPQSQCSINYAHVLLYIPEKNKAITWNLGQNDTFYAEDWQTAYDEEMLKSFKVLL